MAIDTLGANALASNSVTTAKIAADAVTSAKIPAGAVVASDVADGSVTTAKLAAGAVTTAKVADDAVTGAKLYAENLGRRNLIINGAMSINQRGATSGVTSGYFVDRFQLSGCSASAVITSSTPTEFPTAITVSATSGNPIILQKIESKMVQHLSGKVVTVSFYAKNISNATTLYTSLQYAGSADNFGSTTTISEQNLGNLTTDWVKYTASWTVPAGGLNGLSLNILCAGSSTFTMGVTGVQLEVGDTDTPFEHRSYGEELQLCQRYFYPVCPKNISGQSIGMAYYYVGTTLLGIVHFPVTMRTAPTITGADVSNYFTTTHNDLLNYLLANRVTTTTLEFYNNSQASGTAMQAVIARSNNANAFIYATAEL